MIVHEPVTLVTDLLLGALAGWLAWRLGGRASTGPAGLWLSRALALSALSAIVGGMYHGFASNFGPVVGRLWWTLTLLLIGLLSAALATSLLYKATSAGRSDRWHRLIVSKFVVFAITAVIHPLFAVAVLDYGLTLLAWGVAAIVMHRPWSGWMLAGLALSALAATAQQSRWAPSPYFNHNDLYHVIQCLALVGMYRAGSRFSVIPA